MMMPLTQPDPYRSPAARLVAPDARTLPLVAASLAADAGGGLARVVLEQRFRNPHAEPLAVVYALPLPHDAAVSGFSFRIGDRRIVGEIDRRQAARERFEQALLDGRTAAIVEQERTSLFTQEIGNVPPGAEVVAEITIDQKLAFVEEGAWEWRFPTSLAPRYLGAAGRVADLDRVTADVTDGALPVRMTFRVNVRDALDGRLPESPSHGLRQTSGKLEQVDPAGVPLDRDVVVRWGVVQFEPGLRLEIGPGPAEATYALLTVVPPARTAVASKGVARDVVALLDVSGSMQGEPIAQAKRVVSALVSTLGEHDSLEMIAFASSATRWKRGVTRVDPAARRDALAWLDGLRAGGGTEMRTAIEDALAPLRGDAQRQIILVTDGQIGFESEIVATILHRLPASSRVHVVGVGSAPNRTLTAGASRAGGGAEILIGLGEDPERAASRLVARTDAPVVVDMTLEGDALVEHAPHRLPDLFAGSPLLVAAKVRSGRLVVRGRTATGAWEARAVVTASAGAEARSAVAALFARERVEDLETDLAAGGDAKALDARIEAVGLQYGISTRLTSWIAVTEDATVDPSSPLRRERMPHELPFGMSIEGLGLRRAGGSPSGSGGFSLQLPAPPPAMGAPMRAPSPLAVPPQARSRMASPSAAKGAGILTRAAGAVGRLFAPSAARPKATVVHARILRRDDAGVILELSIAQATAWAPPSEVSVVWDDGTSGTATVAIERSTRAGDVAAGTLVRLVVDTTDARTIASLSFELAGTTWNVVL